MSLYDQYGTDAKKEAEGVEVALAPNDDGTIPTFVLAATSRSNQKYAKALDNATKPYRRNIDAMKPETAEALYRDVFVKTVLKGWKNVQDRNGVEIPYSAEAAVKLFTELPRLYDDLNSRAGSIDLFRESQKEEEAGN